MCPIICENAVLWVSSCTICEQPMNHLKKQPYVDVLQNHPLCELQTSSTTVENLAPLLKVTVKQYKCNFVAQRHFFQLMFLLLQMLLFSLACLFFVNTFFICEYTIIGLLPEFNLILYGSMWNQMLLGVQALHPSTHRLCPLQFQAGQDMYVDCKIILF